MKKNSKKAKELLEQIEEMRSELYVLMDNGATKDEIIIKTREISALSAHYSQLILNI